MTIQHKAGQMINGVQHCLICGIILCDYRNTLSPDKFTPEGWAENADIFITGNMTSTIAPLIERFIQKCKP